jgi:hypothetical protein
MKKLLIPLLGIAIFLSGCGVFIRGGPERLDFEDEHATALIAKYSKPDAIPIDETKITDKERNQILDDFMYLIDVNYYKFETELYQGRAIFDTTTDLAILGLGAAGALATHSGTQAILSAISGGIGGSRTSINKNFFYEKSTQALIAKMQSSRKTIEEFIRKGMTLSLKDYSLVHGLKNIVQYHNAGTIVGALENITADAGAEKAKSDIELKKIITVKYDDSVIKRPSKARINRWLDKDVKKNVPILEEWLLKRTPPVTLTADLWIEAATLEELKEAIKQLIREE